MQLLLQFFQRQSHSSEHGAERDIELGGDDGEGFVLVNSFVNDCLLFGRQIGQSHPHAIDLFPTDDAFVGRLIFVTTFSSQLPERLFFNFVTAFESQSLMKRHSKQPPFDRFCVGRVTRFQCLAERGLQCFAGQFRISQHADQKRPQLIRVLQIQFRNKGGVKSFGIFRCHLATPAAIP